MKLERFGKGVAKGLSVTLKYAFTRPITTQYPEERLTPSKRFRGYHLLWSKERCTGCATCAKSCPQGNIEIITHPLGNNYYAVDKFEVDTGRCMFCGDCVESCPFNALFMGREYERATYSRESLVQSRDEITINAETQVSAYYKPDLENTLPEQTLLLNRSEEKPKAHKGRG